MIREMAHIFIKPGAQAEFEAGVRQALPIFKRAKGCRHVELHHIIEHPGQYVLLIHWETLEDHMVHFRQSPDFQEWRNLVGDHFARPPEVIHTEVVVTD